MQTIFQGTNVKYFEVHPEMYKTIGLRILLGNLLEQADKYNEKHKFKLNHINKTIVTKTPWLHTRRKKKFKGRNLHVLMKMTEKLEKPEGNICRLENIGLQVIQRR